MQSSIILIAALTIVAILEVQCAPQPNKTESPIFDFFDIEEIVDQFAMKLFPSSQQNADLVRRVFHDNSFLRWFWVWSGDDATAFRDDFIRRKQSGDNAAAAFAGALLTPSTWKLNPNATKDEVLHPFVGEK